MRELESPFRFNFKNLTAKAKSKFGNRVDGVSINLPFVSFTVNPDDKESDVAREIVIRLADRRVLSARECCDNCIDAALESLQSIRSILVDKQVELSHKSDGSLYLVIEYMLEGIRQFLTFQQRLQQVDETAVPLQLPSSFRRSRTTREKYFAALEMLRAHLHRSLLQIATIAKMDIPRIASNMRYDQAWQLEAYESVIDDD